MCSARYLTVAVAVIGVLSYFAYSPLPPCFDDMPVDVRWSVRLIPLFYKLRDIAEEFGLSRKLLALHRLVASRQPDTDTMRSLDTSFAGVPVRVYLPLKRVPNGPALFYLHGGGWVTGSVDMADKLVGVLAEQLNILSVSVEYRLAPVTPYPAALDDVEQAFRYFVDHAAEFGVDPSRISAAGDSAGGNLVAALTIRLRDKAKKVTSRSPQPRVKFQMLFYPVLQSVNFSTVSMLLNKDDHVVPRSRSLSSVLAYALGMDYYNKTLRSLAVRYLEQGCYRLRRPDVEDVYKSNGGEDIRERIASVSERAIIASLQHDAEVRRLLSPVCDMPDNSVLSALHEKLACLLEPDFSPLLSRTVEHLPPAYIVSCGYDIFRDDALLYIERLRDAGILVEHRHEAKQCHGFIGFSPNKIVKELGAFFALNALL